MNLNQVLRNLGYELWEDVMQVVEYIYTLHDIKWYGSSKFRYVIQLNQGIVDGEVVCDVCGKRLPWRESHIQSEITILENKKNHLRTSQWAKSVGHKDCLISVRKTV